MATSDCSPVIFRKTSDNAFYFQVVTKADIDLESDAFQASELPTTKCWVRSKDNKTLLLLNKEHFEAQNLDSGELCQPDCHFKIKTFNQVPEESKVPAAMLYVTVDNENMVVCCGKERKIYPEKKDIPQGIDGNKSKEIFYMTKLESSGCYEFESSEYRGYYLGFQPDASDPSFIQLVLHPKCGGEVVDACEVKIHAVFSWEALGADIYVDAAIHAPPTLTPVQTRQRPSPVAVPPQQDSVPCHITKTAQEWSEECDKELGTSAWPPDLPGSSLVKHLWDLL